MKVTGNFNKIAHGSEIPSDPALPALASALDPERMGQAFQRALGSNRDWGTLTVDGCRICDVQYLPGESCLICYGVRVLTADGRSGEQLYSGMLTAGGQTIPPQSHLERRPAFGWALVELSEIGLTVVAFPNDPRLTWLPLALDPLQVEQILHRSLPSDQDGWRVIEAVPIHYRPGRSCVIRYLLQKGEDRMTLFGKTHHTRTEQVYQAMRALWDQSPQSAGSFRIPEPLGYGRDARLLLQAALPGKRLQTYLRRPELRGLLTASGRALALFQRLPQPAIQGGVAGLERLVRDAEGLGRSALPVTDRFRRHLNELVRLAPEPATAVVYHGGINCGNILIANGDLGLIDFDQIGVADPMKDLGSFAASVIWDVAKSRTHLNPGEAEAAVLSGYTDESDLHLGRYYWHQALYLTRKSFLHLRGLWNNSRREMDERLALAEQCLSKASRYTR